MQQKLFNTKLQHFTKNICTLFIVDNFIFQYARDLQLRLREDLLCRILMQTFYLEQLSTIDATKIFLLQILLEQCAKQIEHLLRPHWNLVCQRVSTLHKQDWRVSCV